MVPSGNLTVLDALIVGNVGTPYESGFFHFRIRCPPDYPIRAPRVRLMNTGDGTVRFGPRLCANGKVCLSILGTWTGSAWSPTQSLSNILLSIQSLLNDNPYHHEPGYENEYAVGDRERHKAIIGHETIRVAVCDMLEEKSAASNQCPQSLMRTARMLFPLAYDHYRDVCQRLLQQGYQGAQMIDRFGETRGRFDPNDLLKRLQALRTRL